MEFLVEVGNKQGRCSEPRCDDTERFIVLLLRLVIPILLIVDVLENHVDEDILGQGRAILEGSDDIRDKVLKALLQDSLEDKPLDNHGIIVSQFDNFLRILLFILLIEFIEDLLDFAHGFALLDQQLAERIVPAIVRFQVQPQPTFIIEMLEDVPQFVHHSWIALAAANARQHVLTD